MLLKIILRSGPCWDSPGWLRVYLAGLNNPVTRFLLLALRIKFSPAVLENIRRADLPEMEKAALFSGAMNLFRAGTDFKTTAAARSPLTDSALLSKVKPGALIVETGVSDGISALGLLAQAGNAEVLLTDLQAAFPYERGPLCTRYYGTDGAYLSLKFPLFLLCTGRKPAPPAGAPVVSLLNPLVSEKFPAVKLAAFDIFTGALPRKADLFKCANVLNLQYFKTDEILRAIANLSANLNEGGWLYIAQNNGKYPDGEAYLGLRKEDGRLSIEEEVNGHELLALIK